MVLFGCVLAWTVAAEPAWQKKIDQDDIRIWQRHQHPQFKQWHTRGVVLVPGDREVVLDLLRQTEHFPSWVHGCEAAENLAGGLIHMVFEGPLWFKDRDVVFSHRTTELTAPPGWLIEVVNQPHQHPGKQQLRMQNMAASWQLRQISPDQVQVVYELYMDPEIGFKSGVNKYNRDAMFLTLKQMRERLTDPNR
ncbi:hypothetical protein [Marinicella meishanensis]|uniref:hypothetical protein n=1 Tax=Marinicella meishanensis TaxID=2873263 RepID=UPI001CC11284|nr:hypothetical protein [Marinicella sp. NBU2979]